MTSGIQDYDTVPEFNAALAANPATRFTTQQLLAYVYPLPRQSGWNYSNANYIAAQLIIEKITGSSYADQLDRRILRPLHLRHTCLAGFTCGPDVTATMPAGYFADPD